jgi:hypothetical protein
MVRTTWMCRRHLLGEHLECHMFLGSLKKKISLIGYLNSNCFEPLKLKERHNLLAAEMISRGYRHKSPLDFSSEVLSYLDETQLNHKIEVESSFQDLVRRCKECRESSIKFTLNLVSNSQQLKKEN